MGEGQNVFRVYSDGGRDVGFLSMGRWGSVVEGMFFLFFFFQREIVSRFYWAGIKVCPASGCFYWAGIKVCPVYTAHKANPVNRSPSSPRKPPTLWAGGRFFLFYI